MFSENVFHIGLKINIQHLHYIFYFMPSHIKTNHKNTFKLVLLFIKKEKRKEILHITSKVLQEVNNIHVNMIFSDIKSLTNLVSVKLCQILCLFYFLLS